MTATAVGFPSDEELVRFAEAMLGGLGEQLRDGIRESVAEARDHWEMLYGVTRGQHVEPSPA
jgi:hypothetical protein